MTKGLITGFEPTPTGRPGELPFILIATFVNPVHDAVINPGEGKTPLRRQCST